MSCQIKIVKGGDRFLYFQILKDGLFQFSETNLSDVTCHLYDSAGTAIADYSQSGSTLIPVILSRDDNGNLQSTTNNDTDIFEIKLVGSTTTNSTVGTVKAKVTLIWDNVDFPDNKYNVPIPDVESDYYLIDDL